MAEVEFGCRRNEKCHEVGPAVHHLHKAADLTVYDQIAQYLFHFVRTGPGQIVILFCLKTFLC